MKTNPILVTGIHRSGTTWVGKMLNLTPYTYYIGEVMRPDSRLLKADIVRYWYQYDDLDDQQELKKELERLLAFDFRWPQRDSLIPSPLPLYRIARRIFGLPRPLLKDPMAAMSAENIAEVFDMKVVCLVRHPAAFAASIKRANWRFGFRNFLAQRELMDDWLTPYATYLKDRSHDFIEEAAVLWVCVYHVLHAYIERNPEWIVCRHEDLCDEPQGTFKTMYERLGLPFNSIVSRSIKIHTSPDNPVVTSEPHSIMRNSRNLAYSWRNEFSASEIRRIQQIVDPISKHYYSDESWKIGSDNN